MAIKFGKTAEFPKDNAEGKSTNVGKGKKIANKGSSKKKIGGKVKQSTKPVSVKQK
jgi:hypothetical protein